MRLSQGVPPGIRYRSGEWALEAESLCRPRVELDARGRVGSRKQAPEDQEEERSILYSLGNDP